MTGFRATMWKRCVITSYSIHYTKLYEAYDRSKPWGVLAMQGHYSDEAVHQINGAYISYGGVPTQYDGAMYTGIV